MAGAFGLGAVLLLPVLALTGGGLLTSPAGSRSRSSSASCRRRVAYVLFARGLKRLQRGRDRDAHARGAAHRHAAGRDRPRASTLRARGLGAALILGGLLVLAAPEVRRPVTVPA